MPVLIDGDNLVHAARSVEGTGLAIGRAAVCERVGRWARRRGERVRIIFDGRAPESGLREQITGTEVEVRFSGSGITADVAIAEALTADSAARRLLVVSSDRQVQRSARRRRAKAIGSSEFWVGIRRDLERPERRPGEPREKFSGDQPDAAASNEWLRMFGFSDESAGENQELGGLE
ncbi:MAG: hypothetical protein CHACPFDD_03016 [Phycisphaerae bacterium]|nr:hypothetical protein [Phycisphaerae bacterium]